MSEMSEVRRDGAWCGPGVAANRRARGRRMKTAVISDTHSDHEPLRSLRGDLLIRCGDVGVAWAPCSIDFSP